MKKFTAKLVFENKNINGKNDYFSIDIFEHKYDHILNSHINSVKIANEFIYVLQYVIHKYNEAGDTINITSFKQFRLAEFFIGVHTEHYDIPYELLKHLECLICTIIKNKNYRNLHQIMNNLVIETELEIIDENHLPERITLVV